MNTRRLKRGLTASLLLAAGASLTLGFWLPVKAELAQILLERAWQAARSGDVDAKPWPWADTSPVAKLALPQFEVSWIVLSGASGRNLAFAPSQQDGSAAPGERGVTLIAGHRDTHFAALRHIRANTIIELEDLSGAIHRYRVASTEIVDAATTRLRLDAQWPTLVLVTCYPFDALSAGGTLRYLITAEAITQPT